MHYRRKQNRCYLLKQESGEDAKKLYHGNENEENSKIRRRTNRNIVSLAYWKNPLNVVRSKNFSKKTAVSLFSLFLCFWAATILTLPSGRQLKSFHSKDSAFSPRSKLDAMYSIQQNYSLSNPQYPTFKSETIVNTNNITHLKQRKDSRFVRNAKTLVKLENLVDDQMLNLRKLDAKHRNSKETSREPDYGGLQIKLQHDGKVLGHSSKGQHQMNGMKSETSNSHKEYDQPENDDCKQAPWHNLYNPTCNIFHEENPFMVSYFVADGLFRDVFQYNSPSMGSMTLKQTRLKRSRVVIKSLRFLYEITPEYFEQIRMDAMVMERLASSPRIVDIYGHCGTSVITEKVKKEIGPSIRFKHGKLLNEKDQKLYKDYEMKYSDSEKLEMALTIAEAIADLHGFKDGPMVHADISLWQFFLTEDGAVKLNDFNLAKALMWDDKNRKYCNYRDRHIAPVDSPEEQKEKPLNEKTDVWSVGCQMYTLLTGLKPFYYIDDEIDIKIKNINGEISRFDKKFVEGSFAEQELVKIIKQCWEYDPDKRVSIFEVVRQLQAAIKENEKLLS